ncbi:ATP-dependent DNA helicase DinG [Salinisphaera shabanensis T35B1]|uniref:ATP-dependent DNA helicase DinG n=1 Tax=Salinisphaera TaxID=180541 RepID=UPI003340DA47
MDDKTDNESIETPLAEIHDAHAQVVRTMPGFREREGQCQMIDEIAYTLLGGTASPLIAIEGQTGTGKTLGYLLPAIPAAQAREKSLIVATATTSLQSQLMRNELPALAKYSGLKFTAVLAKGRSRYACPFRLETALAQGSGHADMFGPDADLPDNTGGFTPSEDQTALLADLQLQLTTGEWDGCKDELDEEIDSRLWGAISSTPHSCTGPNQCAPMGLCPFHRSRAAMRDADVIVANHDLVLSDVFLGGGMVLPDPKDTFYIFDEGHHLPEKAVEHGSARSSIGAMREHVRSLQRLLPKLPAHIHRPDIREPAKDAESALQALSDAYATLAFTQDRDELFRYRAPHGKLPAPVREAANALHGEMAVLWEVANDMAEELDDKEGSAGAQHIARVLAPEMGKLAGLLENDLRLLRLLKTEQPDDAPPIARWAEHDNNELWLEAAPVTAAPMLRTMLWDKCAGAVITSATLTSLNRWSRFRAKAGLSGSDGTRYLRLLSPFDYPRIAELRVPWMKHDGGQAREHTEEIKAMMPSLLAHCSSGTLVLFASWYQLNAVYKSLPAPQKKRVLCQGKLSRDTLVARHRKTVAAGNASVIFGLASMAEGVDLAGSACEHVIIAKLPFAPPTSPIEATRAEWLEKHGKNPFMTMAVPDASLKLIQACGRLIRCETDQGRITLLDRRIVTKRYGKQLLDSLPPFHQSIERKPPPAAQNTRQAAIA